MMHVQPQPVPIWKIRRFSLLHTLKNRVFRRIKMQYDFWRLLLFTEQDKEIIEYDK